MVDSPFAYFDDVVPGPIKRARGQTLDLSPRALEVHGLLRTSSAALTTTMLARYLRCKKAAIQRNLYSLQRAGLAYRVDCFRDGHSVRVWLDSAVPYPNPRETARLAALGLLFLRLRREYPGLVWEVLPGQLARVIISKAHLVDPVRRSEKPDKCANLLIYPTLGEAQHYTKNRNLFTADSILLSRDTQLFFFRSNDKNDS